MSQNTMGEDEGRSAMTVGGQTKSSFSRSNDLREQLFPGLPNEITLDVIAPKLSWKNFYILFRVSPCWQQAIQTRLVYDARVSSDSTETFVAVHKKFDGPTNHKFAIALYSMRDDSWRELPEVPGLSGVAESQCVSLDGKIYVLGGGAKGPSFTSGRSEVYVLDLAGQRQWIQCASMQDPRLSFGAGVFDGKIYVFGGISLGELVCNCEVYDPKIDAWSWLNPMIIKRFDHRVSTMGEGLLVCGGSTYDVSSLEGAQGSSIDKTVLAHTKNAPFYEVYHPVKDKWTSIETSAIQDITERGLTAEGNIHPYEYSWEDLGCYFPSGDDLFLIETRCEIDEYRELLAGGIHIRFIIGPWCGLAVDRVYLALRFHSNGWPSPYDSCGWGLLRNSGSTWRVAKFYPSSQVLYRFFEKWKSPLDLCAVQL